MHVISVTSAQERRLEVADFNSNDGARIQIWGPNVADGYRSQTWDFLPVKDSAMIVNVHSGKCLNIPIGRNPLNQEFLQQFTCSGAPNDTWRLEPVFVGAERDCR